MSIEATLAEVGGEVTCVMTKWGNRPHWVYTGTYLGSDEAGDWIAFPAGSRFTRPGVVYVAPSDQVGLVPAPGERARPGFLATFHAAGGPVQTYVDITTPATWQGSALHAVDLDLDVVRGWTGRVWVDDEDEFAAHRTTLGYPADLVAHATTWCDRVQDALTRGRPPFDGREVSWLARVGA